jgi:hypothetical protein
VISSSKPPPFFDRVTYAILVFIVVNAIVAIWLSR